MTDDAIEIELDDTPASRRVIDDRPLERPLELDTAACLGCGAVVPLNADSECRSCYEEVRAAYRESQGYPPVAVAALSSAVEDDLARMMVESRAVAAPAAAFGSVRSSGFVAPTGNTGVVESTDSGAADEAVALMRARAAQRASEAEAQRRAGREGAIVPAPEAEAKSAAPALRHGDIVAGAVAEGHGVIVGWRGQDDLTRSALLSTLAGAGLPIEWAPEAASARAQAGRALSAGAEGHDVRAEKKSARQVVEDAEYDHRWLVAAPNYGGGVGDKSGDIVLVATLTGDDLTLEGDEEIAARVRADYDERIGQERYRSSDVTTWIATVLREELDAVRFGVGWYVPRMHAATAARLCEAFSSIPWGTDWIVPALPVATSDQLRAGILRGLGDEVEAVVRQLANERDTAKTRENREDIGNKRAATFLRQLREIGGRVVAYGALLGEARVATLRDTIHAAVVELESSLSEDDAAIVARFANIWEEIEIDRRNSGGVL